MFDFLRVLHPQILSVVVFLLVLWIAIIVSLKIDKRKDVQRVLPKIGRWITGLTVLGFLIYALQFASVNETPRAVIDRSATEEGKKNFEKRMQEEANKPKITDSTTTQKEVK
ncbi:MAG: hypothetical protein WCW78_00670 [Candidatus Paceibacterota bacterium]|jgi:hypothetical protein